MVDVFFKVEVAPFPKSQSQTEGLPVEASVKLTTSGEQPDTGVAEKPAVGACAHAIQESHTQRSVKMISLRIKFSQFNRFVLADDFGW